MGLAFVLILAVCLRAFAQEEKKMAADLGMEWNGNSRNTVVAGLAFSLDYNLPVSAVPLAIGFAVTSSNNFGLSEKVVEFAALFRWYFEEKTHTGFFLQTEAGYSLIFDNSGKNLP